MGQVDFLEMCERTQKRGDHGEPRMNLSLKVACNMADESFQRSWLEKDEGLSFYAVIPEFQLPHPPL